MAKEQIKDIYKRDRAGKFIKGTSQRPWNKGKHPSEEQLKKLRDSHKGQISWMKGKKTPQEVKDKISKAMKGRKPWNYTGTSISPYKLMQGSTEWKVWRNKVYERDSFICQDCNRKGTFLHPHHIIPIKDCIKTKRMDLIFDINNGRTLCVECHRQVHRKKGVIEK